MIEFRKILMDGRQNMSQLKPVVNAMQKDSQLNGYVSTESKVLDYDDQPYGDDNLLVRAYKRRTFLIPPSRL